MCVFKLQKKSWGAPSQTRSNEGQAPQTPHDHSPLDRENHFGGPDEVIDVCEAGGFKVKEVHFNKQFKNVMGTVLSKRNIKMNHCDSKEHALCVERSN